MHRQPDADTPPLDVRSEQLVILPDDDTISTTLPALVTRGQSRMNGTGMKYNNKTRQLEVFSSTNVEIAPADTQHAGSKDQPKDRPAGPSKDQPKPADGSPAPRSHSPSPAGAAAAPAQAPAHASVKKQS
jgi:lipopolysaccharide export system protein LptC